MLLDPRVARAKYKREVERLNKQAPLLQEMGVWPQRAVFPVIDLVFLRRNPPRLLLGLKQKDATLQIDVTLGGLTGAPFGVRLGLEDYDIVAPKVTFHDPWTWEPLPPALIPPGLLTPEGGPGTDLIVHGHPYGGHSFLCLRGTRDYHVHPQHSADEWFQVRPDFSVFALVQEIWRFFVLNPTPLVPLPLRLPDTFTPATPQPGVLPMATARFFDRTAFAVGGALGINRAKLETLLAASAPGILVHEAGITNDRHIAELSVNLLARLYPRMAVAGAGALADDLRGLARAINPLIEFVPLPDPNLTIAVGDHPVPGGVASWADGWIARLSDTHTGTGPDNPYAAGAAAAFAVGEVFRRALVPDEARRPWRDLNLSLLDYGDAAGAREPLPAVDLGAVGYIGVGAVGNAGLWALARHRGLEGTLDLVDHESVELSNLQRYVLTDDRSVDVRKVLLGSRALRGTRLRVRRRLMTLETWADRMPQRGFPTLCISTDSSASRRYAQALLPRLVVNGWTGTGTYGASSHTFACGQPCLACLYHPTGPTKSVTERVAEALGLEHRYAAELWVRNEPLPEADVPTVATKLGVPEAELEKWKGISIRQLHQDVICGGALVHLRAPTEAPQFVPLAHQSALAGVLMAAELVKRSSPALAERAQSEQLVRCDNVLRRTRGAWPVLQERVPGCICGDHDYHAAYAHKWA